MLCLVLLLSYNSQEEAHPVPRASTADESTLDGAFHPGAAAAGGRSLLGTNG